MNLSSFLKRINKLTSQMTKEELAAVIHEIARTLPQERREWLLLFFEDHSSNTSGKNSAPNATVQLFEKLDMINSGKLHLDSSYNEMWDDWYDDMSSEFNFEDPDKILETINSACSELHQSIDRADYAGAYHLGKRLLALEVRVDGDYDENMTVSDLCNYDLIETPLENIVLDTLYAAYYEEPCENRAEAIYRLGKPGHFNEWTLEKLIQSAPDELPDINVFLRDLVNYLGNISENTAETLLYEAVDLLNDPLYSLETARKYYSVHPGI